MLPDKTHEESHSGFLLTPDDPFQFAINPARSYISTFFYMEKTQNLVRAQIFYTVARITCIYSCIRSSAMPGVAESTSSSPEHCCKLELQEHLDAKQLMDFAI